MVGSPSRFPFAARGFVAILTALLFAAAICAGTGTTARAAGSPLGQIAYVQPSPVNGLGDGIYMVNVDGSSPRLLTRGLGRVGDLAWSADGSRLAIISGQSSTGGPSPSCRRLSVMNADGSSVRTIDVQIPARARAGTWSFEACAWSPDSSLLAVALQSDGGDSVMGDSWVLLVDPASGSTERLAGPRDYACSSISWNPGGIRLLVSAAAEETGWLETVDLDTGEASPLSRTPENAYMTWWASGAYSPDGDRIACVRSSATQTEVADYEWSSQIYLLTTEGLPDATPVFSGRVSGTPSWSPDGRWLAFGCGVSGSQDSHVRICPAGGGKGWSLVDDAAQPAWRPVPPGGRASQDSDQCQASCYGADYGSNEDGSRDIASTSSPKLAAPILRGVGFDARVRLNDSAERAVSRLPEDTIFYFDGHGNWDILSFAEPDGGARSALITSLAPSYQHIDRYVPLGASNLFGLELAIFNSCDAAVDISSPGNLMKEFTDAGCACAIGFDGEISVTSANRWAQGFFDHACRDGLEVGAAAAKAAEDTRTSTIFFWNREYAVAPELVVVKRRMPGELYIDQSPPVLVQTLEF